MIFIVPRLNAALNRQPDFAPQVLFAMIGRKALAYNTEPPLYGITADPGGDRSCARPAANRASNGLPFTCKIRENQSQYS